MHSKSITLLIAAGIFAGAAWLILRQPGDSSSTEPTPLPAQGTAADNKTSSVLSELTFERRSILAIWDDSARQGDLPKASRSMVRRLVADSMPDPQASLPAEIAEGLPETLERYLQQYGAMLSDPSQSTGTAYWTAWLLLECARRQVLSAQEKANIRAEYFELFDELVELIREELHSRVGQDNESLCGIIDQGLATLGENLRRRFSALQDDVFFPAFRSPLHEKGRAIAVQVATNDRYWPEFEEPSRMLVLKEEWFLKQLQPDLRDLPSLVFCQLVVEQLQPELLKTRYWGRMDKVRWSSASVREGPWPIYITFEPYDEWNKLTN